MPTRHLILLGVVLVALSACGSTPDSPSSSSGRSSAAAATPATGEAFGQGDCTADGATGTPLPTTIGPQFSMVVANPWTQASSMGSNVGTLWRVNDTDDGQNTYMNIADVGVAHDAASAAADDAKKPGNSPVMTCQIGGEQAYFVKLAAQPSFPASYQFYLQHSPDVFVNVQVVIGQVPSSTWIPQVKRMLGSWTWATTTPSP